MKKRHRALAIAAWALLGLSTVSVARSADAACDRQCLKEFVDQYIAAMIAHDARKAPLARDIVIVENLKRIGTDAGLWASTSAAPNAFRIYVPDTVQQQIGYIGFMQADGKPVEFALRLKVAQGRIVEAEHLVAYSLRENVLAHFEKPRAAFSQSVSDEYRDSRGRLLKIAADYYDALDENNGALAPFADDCVRFENGMQTVRNVVPADPAASPFGILGSLGCEQQLNTGVFQYITRIDNRRVFIADEETGLAFGLSHFHHAMDQTTFRVFGVPGVPARKMEYKPFDFPAAHVFKIWGGQIHEIEALGFSTDYQSPTGWER